MNLFSGFKPYMTDATVSDPDYSEAELETIEPEENATKDEKDPFVEAGEDDRPEELGTEALSMLRISRSRIKNLRSDLAKKINKLVNLDKAIRIDSARNHGRLPQTLKIILMDEGVVDSEIISDSAADDIVEAAKESDPSEVAEKGATEEELVKASLRAQHHAYLTVYKKLKNM